MAWEEESLKGPFLRKVQGLPDKHYQDAHERMRKEKMAELLRADQHDRAHLHLFYKAFPPKY